jgi:hypothetical protein
LLEKVAGQNVQKATIGPFEIEDAKQLYVEPFKLLMASFVTDNALK